VDRITITPKQMGACRAFGERSVLARPEMYGLTSRS
jgi:hypothetical protein